PDANTLHRIAKDANPNKVDAEVNDSGIILRQADVVDAPIAPAPLAAQKAVAAKPQATPVEKEAKDDDSFVADAVFTSCRAAFEAAAHEPEKPAAELLREDEDDAKDETAQTVQRAIKQVAETVAKTSKPEPVTPKPAAKVTEPKVAASAEVEAGDEIDKTEPVAAKLETLPEKDPAEVLAEANMVANRATRLQELRQSDDILREEEALERLLETTNTKLSAPSHARRSNALERLKAAVAATEAERRMRGSAKTSRPAMQDLGNDPETFRKEIKTVRRAHEDDMKITRPVVKRDGTPRRRASVTTLILGSDQRVDGSDSVDADTVKKKSDAEPVAVQPSLKPALKIVELTEDHSGFAAFADKTGATTLHELLEASAAYLAIVEDQPRFSQENLVSNLEAYLHENEISEDATNRSLSRLLRDGKILQVKKDRFTISKSARHGFQSKLAG
ncbi:MAG: hypothetical protein GY947_21405, partial [Rhodobacteraceae bacterium]|nr:hypothetical protein [Paracoccaceae bacterium]